MPRCTRRESWSLPTRATARAFYAPRRSVRGARLPAYEFRTAPGRARNTGAISSMARAGYAGVGPGAHGRLDIDGGRHATAREAAGGVGLMQVDATGTGSSPRTADPEEGADDFLLMGLPLAEGIDPAR